MIRFNMPDEIRLRTGEVLKPVIGGHLETKPFLTQVDVTKNGWGMGLLELQINNMIVEEAKRRKLKYRRVMVYPRKNLRAQRDIRGRPYFTLEWVFVESKERWKK